MWYEYIYICIKYNVRNVYLMTLFPLCRGRRGWDQLEEMRENSSRHLELFPMAAWKCVTPAADRGESDERRRPHSGVLAKLYFTETSSRRSSPSLPLPLPLPLSARSYLALCPLLLGSLPAPEAHGARRTKRTMTQNETGHGDKKNATRVSETNSDTKAIWLRATCVVNYIQQGIYFYSPLSLTYKHIFSHVAVLMCQQKSHLFLTHWNKQNPRLNRCGSAIKILIHLVSIFI